MTNRQTTINVRQQEHTCPAFTSARETTRLYAHSSFGLVSSTATSRTPHQSLLGHLPDKLAQLHRAVGPLQFTNFLLFGVCLAVADQWLYIEA